MTTFGVRVLVIAAVVILVFTSSAFAGCAWVLWGVSYQETETYKRDRILRESMEAFGQQATKEEPAPKPQYYVIWEPVSAHESLKLCDVAMGMAKDLLPHKKFFKCLPDSVDPHGPRGTGR